MLAHAQILKVLALALFVGLLLAHWLSDLTAATVGVLVAYILLVFMTWKT